MGKMYDVEVRLRAEDEGDEWVSRYMISEELVDTAMQRMWEVGQDSMEEVQEVRR